MNKLLILGLFLISSPMFGAQPAPTANQPSKPAPVPAWMKTSPWFTPATLDNIGDSSWNTLDPQGGGGYGGGGGNSTTSASPFNFANEDIPAGPSS